MERKVILVLLFASLAGCSRDARSPGDQQGDVSKPSSVANPAEEQPQSVAGIDAYADIPDNTPVVHRTQAGEPGVDGWCIAESTRGSFSVAMPGQFADYMLKSTTTTGGIGIFHTVVTKDVNGAEFNVLQTESIDTPPRAALSTAEALSERFKNQGANVSRHSVTVGSLPADRLSVRAPGVSAEMVLFSRASSNYMIAVQWHGQAAENLNEDIERFFSSFKIVTQDE